MNSPKQFNKIQISFIKEFIRRMKKYYIKKQYMDKFDYITQNPFWYVKRDLTKIIRSKIFDVFHNNIFDKINKNEQYYLFPLHLQPEASTLMMAPYYVNQPATIENIAKSLPGNTYLYVKEHTSSYGIHNLYFYEQIKNIPNVRLISPYENTKKLIVNSICPIVLTSTVGWEALMMGKPVVVLGEVFYKSSGLVYSPKDYNELSYILKYEIKKYNFDKKKFIKFLASIRLSSYKGIFSPAQFQESKILSKQNINEIYIGIKNELLYWKKK
jgi:capsule polysaccharide modification protein KpsS